MVYLLSQKALQASVEDLPIALLLGIFWTLLLGEEGKCVFLTVVSKDLSFERDVNSVYAAGLC